MDYTLHKLSGQETRRKKRMESDMPAWWRSKWMIKKSKRQLFQTMVGCARGKQARNHGQIAVNGEEFENG